MTMVQFAAVYLTVKFLKSSKTIKTCKSAKLKNKNFTVTVKAPNFTARTPNFTARRAKFYCARAHARSLEGTLDVRLFTLKQMIFTV